jgi:hypothetical protein
MTAFCTHCGARLSADPRHCTECGSAAAPIAKDDAPIAALISEIPMAKKDRRWQWWLLAVIVFFALGVCLSLLLAPKCPSCPVPAGDGTGSGRNAHGSRIVGAGGLEPPTNQGIAPVRGLLTLTLALARTSSYLIAARPRWPLGS